ncbi:MAG: hypothetical protein WC804_20015 [Sphingomonas sp.]|jgi:hypothetical protein|uniref:hypothetical protein n=1 Tax=Sphingomonas sp. TaxID=28214 RepID=UPI003561EF6E
MFALSLLLVAATAPVVHHPVTHTVITHRVRHRVARRAIRHRRQIDTRLHLAGCGYTATGLCATSRSPYRLPIDAPLPPTAKADAMAQTGRRCALIGQTICPSHTRTIVHVER